MHGQALPIRYDTDPPATHAPPPDPMETVDGGVPRIPNLAEHTIACSTKPPKQYRR